MYGLTYSLTHPQGSKREFTQITISAMRLIFASLSHSLQTCFPMSPCMLHFFPPTCQQSIHYATFLAFRNPLYFCWIPIQIWRNLRVLSACISLYRDEQNEVPGYITPLMLMLLKSDQGTQKESKSSIYACHFMISCGIFELGRSKFSQCLSVAPFNNNFHLHVVFKHTSNMFCET